MTAAVASGLVVGMLPTPLNVEPKAASGLSSAKISCASDSRVKCGCGTVGVPPLLMRDCTPSSR